MIQLVCDVYFSGGTNNFSISLPGLPGLSGLPGLLGLPGFPQKFRNGCPGKYGFMYVGLTSDQIIELWQDI